MMAAEFVEGNNMPDYVTRYLGLRDFNIDVHWCIKEPYPTL